MFFEGKITALAGYRNIWECRKFNRYCIMVTILLNVHVIAWAFSLSPLYGPFLQPPDMDKRGLRFSMSAFRGCGKSVITSYDKPCDGHKRLKGVYGHKHRCAAVLLGESSVYWL